MKLNKLLIMGALMVNLGCSHFNYTAAALTSNPDLFYLEGVAVGIATDLGILTYETMVSEPRVSQDSNDEIVRESE